MTAWGETSQFWEGRMNTGASCPDFPEVTPVQGEARLMSWHCPSLMLPEPGAFPCRGGSGSQTWLHRERRLQAALARPVEAMAGQR